MQAAQQILAVMLPRVGYNVSELAPLWDDWENDLVLIRLVKAGGR